MQSNTTPINDQGKETHTHKLTIFRLLLLEEDDFQVCRLLAFVVV
jgi:hypothetical protein